MKSFNEKESLKLPAKWLKTFIGSYKAQFKLYFGKKLQ